MERCILPKGSLIGVLLLMIGGVLLAVGVLKPDMFVRPPRIAVAESTAGRVIVGGESVNETFRQLGMWSGLADECIEGIVDDLVVVPCQRPNASSLGDSATRMYLDATEDYDAVRSEASRAFLRRLKPGWTRGVALVLREVFVEAAVLLLGYRDRSAGGSDWQVGNVRAFHQFTRVYARVAGGAQYALTEFRWELPQTEDMAGLHKSQPRDPRSLAAPVVATLESLLWERMVSNEELGYPRREALARSVDEIGRTVFRSLLYLGEHQLCLVDLVDAIIAADLRFHNGCNVDAIEQLFAERGIQARDLAPCSREAESQAPTVAWLPSSPSDGHNGVTVVDRWIYTFGERAVTVSYTLPPRRTETPDENYYRYIGDQPFATYEGAQRAYASVRFDNAGRMVAMHCDPPAWASPY